MDEREWLAERFEENRRHLRAVAHRMLGSFSEADDAVQEAWLRLSRSDSSAVENLRGWLTTIVGRVCLDMLRSRRSRREESFEVYPVDPAASQRDGGDPEHHAVMVDSVGLALLVVLDTLDPAERLAFVLHDMFAVPFEEIASILDRTPTAARQLASRARRRVQGADAIPEPDLSRQRKVVDAFFAAAVNGDFDALVAVLDPDVVARSDAAAVRRGTPTVVRGAAAVARRALVYAQIAQFAQPALVNGAPGVIGLQPGQRLRVMAFVVAHEKIVEIDVVADPARLRRLDLALLGTDEATRP